MALTVEEIMNRELVSARADERPERLRDIVLSLGISALPVLDDERRPIGVVSLRDLLGSPAGGPLRFTTPASVVHRSTYIELAARTLAETCHHHLVVVDDSGRAVGMVSGVDLMRGILGMPARHPASFPHFDPALSVSWSDDTSLDLHRLSVAPDEAGVIVLVHGGARMREQPVWVEQTPRLRERLEQLACAPLAQPPVLAAILARDALRFRVSVIADDAKRAEVVRIVRASITEADACAAQ